MPDTSHSTEPETKAAFLNSETVALFCGAILVIFAYFLPWLGKEDFILSGFTLSNNGYPFLFSLPLLALAAFYLKFRNRNLRPLPQLLLGVGGLLFVFLLIALVFNNDTGNLIFYKRAGIAPHLRFQTGAEYVMFESWHNISGGFYLLLLGFIIISLAPLLRPDSERPAAGHQAAEECELTQPISLEDLRPSWVLQKEFKSAVAVFVIGTILIITYTWCGISPMKLWENRGHAREYLFGRVLNGPDLEYIEDQTARAPEIEAQGLARAYQDNKYRSIPIAEQPSLQEKFKENEALVKKYLSEMSESKKQQLREAAHHNAMDEKRGGYFPPETAWEKVKGYLFALLETVAIAIWGTLLAIICAVPASLFAADNTLKLMVSGDGRVSRIFRWFCIFGVRRFLDSCRGFNEFVMALIFVAVIGLGPFAGILALWIHTFGILGKVFSEQIEAIDGGQLEALTSTGAAVDQTIAFSVLPQVMPGFVSYSLLRFESNVRSATILGFVGAGGIGFLMFDKLNGYLFREVCTMMVIIIVAVSIIDYLCGKLRRRFI